MSDLDNYVRADEHGALRVGNGRVMLDSVLAAWADGHSPETIRQQYPSLSLDEVYGAIAWCLSHRDTVDQYIVNQAALWQQWKQRSEAAPSPLRDRLRQSRLTSGTR